ncbi:MAG: hypothetical protein KGD63_00265 [Candidatus Lokiarchaeota archaeon]|nr:hypothetical protein [Candidatus Lokiarchaeota archaeon]
MDSKSDQKIERATEIVWKFWWFCVYLLILPSIIMAISYFLCYNFFNNFSYVLSLSFLFFFISQFIFFRSYDKYRKNPFFGTEKINISTRITIIFITPLISMIVSVAFSIINFSSLEFQLIPLIYLFCIYPIIFFYLRKMPILYYNSEIKSFINIKKKYSIKEVYKYIILINYISNIIFFALNYNAIYISSGVISILNCVFFIITMIYTREERKIFKEDTKLGENQLKRIILNYDKKITNSLQSEFFILLVITLGLNIYFISLQSYISYTDLIPLIITFFLIFILYLKVRIITYLYYKNKFRSLEEVQLLVKDEIKDKTILKYQNFNAILTFILLLTLILIFYIGNLNYLNFIFIPLFYILIYKEHDYGYIQKKNIEVLYFILTIVSLGYISFFIIPNSVLLVIKFLIFTISIYFSLELFKRINLFLDEKVVLWQNILSVITFFLISYSIYPAVITEDVLQILNPNELLITRILIFLIFFLFTLLISLYRLNSTFFKEKSSKIIKSAIITNFLLLDLVFILFLDFRAFKNIDPNYFLSFSLFSAIIFIVIFIFFLYFNSILKVIKNISGIIYRSLWILLPLIVITSAITSCIPVIIIENFDSLLITLVILVHTFIFSCSIQYLLKYGEKINKISEERYGKFIKITLFSISFEISIISFLLSYVILNLDLNISIFVSILVLGAIITILNRYYQSVLEKYKIFINSIIILYLTFIMFYYSLLLTLNSTFAYIIPFILFCVFFNFFIQYLISKNIGTIFNKRLLKYNNLILSLFFVLIPTIICIELIKLEIYVDIFNIINSTLYILLGVLFIYILIAKKKKSEKKLSSLIKFQVIIGYVLAGTMIFYYLYTIIPGQYIKIIASLLITLSYLYILLLFTYKKEFFNKKLVQISIFLDMLLIIGLTVSIPTFIGLELEIKDSIGFINTINFSLYILFAVLFIFYFISKKRTPEKLSLILLKIQIIIGFILAGTTIFYYLYAIIPGQYIKIIASLLMTLSYLYILLIFTYKKEFFNKKLVQISTFLDMLLIIGLTVSIPIFIGLELEIKDSIGFINTINFSLYILFAVLFIFYSISKKRTSEKLSLILLKIQIIIGFILAGTTIFYYLSYIIPGHYIKIIFPLTTALFYLYLLLLFSHKKAIFNKDLIQKFILMDIFLLICSIILIPTFIQLELATINNTIEIIYIFIFSLLLLFLILKFAEFTSDKLNLRSIIVSYIKITLIISWFLISLSFLIIIFNYIELELLFDSYIIGVLVVNAIFLSFLLISTYCIKLIKNLSEYYNFIEKPSLSDRTNLIKNLLKIIYFYAMLIESSLILSSSVMYSNFIPKTLVNLEIFNFILLITLFFILLHPLVINFSIDSRMDNLHDWVKRFSPLFLILIIDIIFSEIYWIALSQDIIGILLYLFSIILINYLYIKKKNTIREIDFLKRYFIFFIEIVLICFSIFYNNIEYFIFGFIILYTLISLERLNRLRERAFIYITLSIVGFLKIIQVLESVSVLELLLEFPLGLFMIIYLMNFNLILIVSMGLNYKKQSLIEKYLFFVFTTGSLFFYILSFTRILLIYDITICTMVLLFLIFVDFYLDEDERYKLFIKPWFILLFFNITSWISYSFLFTDPNYLIYNIILTFTLTSCITSIGFILLNNNLPEQLRKITYTLTLIIISLFIPIFIYTLLISYFGFFGGDLIMIIILLNIMVLLFYISIGIYNWKISWTIWKIGWKIWLIVPLINFYLIYRNFIGVDIFTEAVNFFGLFEIEGSIIITVIICSLIYLPALFSVMRKHFTKILIAVWGESLALTFWASQNLFKENLILSSLFFGLASIFLLAPILLRKRYWKLLSLLWLSLMILNISFLTVLLISMNLNIELVVSIDIITFGLFLIIYSLFPKVKNYFSVLIISYSIIFLGIFLLIFFIFYNIINNLIISFNLASIFISGTLLSSKYFKLNQKIIRSLISILMISNLSSLTYVYLSLIPNLEILSIAVALTICSISLIIFQRFNYIFRSIDFTFLWIFLSLSLSFLSASILYLFIPENIFLIIAVSCLVVFVFIQKIMYNIKYLLIYLYPIPLSFLILASYNFIEIFGIFTIFLFLLAYLISLQILISLFYNFSKREKEKANGPIYKYVENIRKVKKIHLLCFVFDSLYISLLVSVFCFNILHFQILTFFTLYPILNLFVLYYLRINGETLGIKGSQWILKNFGGLFYSIIPFSISGLVSYFIMDFNFPIIYTTLILLIISNGILFIELLLNNYGMKFFSGDKNKKIALLSLFVSINSISIMIFTLLITFSTLEILSLCLVFLLSLLGLNILSLTISEKLLPEDIRLIKKFQNNIIFLSYILITGIVSSFLSESTLDILVELEYLNFSYYILFIFYYAVILLFFTYLINILKEKKIEIVMSISYIIFQIFLTLNILNYILIYGELSLFLVNLLIFLNLILTYVSINYINIFNLKSRYSKFTNVILSLLSNIFYFYVNLLLFSALVGYLDIYTSLSISLGTYILVILMDMMLFKKINNRFILLLLIPLINLFSITLIISLNRYFVFSLVHFKLSFMFLVIVQFITNYLYLMFRTLKFKDKDIKSKFKLSSIENWYKKIKIILGICLYISLIVFVQDLIGYMDIFYQIFIIGIIVFSISFIDDITFNFLEGVKEYIKVISWVLIMITSNSFIFISIPIVLVQSLMIRIPIFILIINLESMFLLFLLTNWNYFKTNRNHFMFILYKILSLDIMTFPLFYLTLDPILDLNLIIFSLIIIIILLNAIKIIKNYKNDKIEQINRILIFVLINLICIDLAILFEIYLSPEYIVFNIYFNINFSLVILLLLYAIFFKVFTQKSLKSTFLFWLLISIFIGTTIFQATYYFDYFPFISSFSFIIFSILLFPFIFLMEQLKDLFNNFIDKIKEFIILIKIKIVNLYKNIISFLKRNWSFIWSIFSFLIGTVIFLLLGIYVEQYWVYSFIISIGLIIFLIYYNMARNVSEQNPGKILKYRIIYLSSSWVSILGIILSYIEAEYYLIVILLSFTILGAIFLPYIYYKEKREKISIKWRFYSTIFFIIVLITTVVLFYFQFFLNYI